MKTSRMVYLITERGDRVAEFVPADQPLSDVIRDHVQREIWVSGNGYFSRVVNVEEN